MGGKRTTNWAVPLLFAVYLVLLVWIILFKLRLPGEELAHIRGVNLIPFYYETDVSLRLHLKDVLENVLIFVPYGIYLCMLSERLGVWGKAGILLGTSLVLEAAQYIFAIGCSDITDVLTNTAGGLLGIGIYRVLLLLLRDRRRTDRVISVLAAVVTVLLLGLITVVFMMN